MGVAMKKPYIIVDRHKVKPLKKKQFSFFKTMLLLV
jgi:hypothetical protein